MSLTRLPPTQQNNLFSSQLTAWSKTFNPTILSACIQYFVASSRSRIMVYGHHKPCSGGMARLHVRTRPRPRWTRSSLTPRGSWYHPSRNLDRRETPSHKQVPRRTRRPTHHWRCLAKSIRVCALLTMSNYLRPDPTTPGRIPLETASHTPHTPHDFASPHHPHLYLPRKKYGAFPRLKLPAAPSYAKNLEYSTSPRLFLR